MVFLKQIDWVLYQLLANTFYRAARKVCNYDVLFRNPSLRTHKGTIYPSVSKCPLECRATKTLVCDIHGTLLRSPSFFPYFMLVAFEGGSIFRAFLLLLASPLMWVLGNEIGLRVMIFLTFSGLRSKDMEGVGRAVLPKFFLEDLNLKVYEVLASSERRVVLTSVPRLMVEGFLKEYLKVDDVLGTELQVVGGFFTGFLTASGLLVKHKAFKEIFGESRPDVGIGGCNLQDHLFISLCKEAYVVNKDDRKTSASTVMPREKYPKPLVFHDGRLAFLPTPMATLSMFLWLPLGIPIAIFRLLVGIFLPYNIAILVVSWTGLHIRVKGWAPPKPSQRKGVLYVCTHRTLLDPIFLSTVLQKPATAVTYSLSKMSEVIAPIRTVRLTRDRDQDGETMQRLLNEGDLVVCPEGTTCREPYLLRFSSLFAELTDEIVPVAMDTHVTMFYGTTASGLKCLDPIFFLMNPFPAYGVGFLGKVPRELTCAGGRTSCDVANHIQRQLADALGFECTTLTRRDKYMMLAGNEGVVHHNNNR
ncbi:glycerol-3-phosphate acyltransferase 1-like [Magnolia sinica]|uniref:glycerol-3-phosphate acyltransferase 1-like n=1 Tax=Magnolia sinica TaxID=86752 RepID=UPI00265A117D|nr:glycerol-3-phosphate acyltransferase 1-like [Magnolia sinica]